MQRRRNLFKNLLLVHTLAEQFPNSGSLVKALTAFRRRIEKLSNRHDDNPSLIALIVDVMYKNPRVYPQAASILSTLLSLEDQDEIRSSLDSIQARFADIPNTGLLDVGSNALAGVMILSGNLTNPFAGLEEEI